MRFHDKNTNAVVCDHHGILGQRDIPIKDAKARQTYATGKDEMLWVYTLISRK
jgi:hypothetical protein